MKLIFHVPVCEGGLSEYAVYQARALKNVEGLELLWHAPGNLSCPDGLTSLPSLPIPPTTSNRSRIRRASDFLSWTLATNQALDQAIAEHRPDAVMLPAWSEYFSPLWAWRFRRWRSQGVRFGALIHDPVRDYQRGGKSLHRLSLRQAYSFLDVAFVHEEIELDTAGAPCPLTIVVPHGPFAVPEGEESTPTLREQLGIPQEARVLLAFGHIRDGKCLDAVLEALVDCPVCHLIVAGREQSSGQKPATYYQQIAARLGIAHRCHWFLGYIPNDQIWRYFRSADTLLLLYSKEFRSMSGVLNLNVQFRLPVLASGGGGPLLHAVQSYRLGHTLEAPTPSGIAKALVASHHPDARWDDFSNDHSWDVNAQRVVGALFP